MPLKSFVLFFLDGHDHVHAPLVPSALKGRGQPGVHDHLGQLDPDHAGAEGQHVAVVVPAGQGCGIRLTAHGTADAPHLVGRQGNADARAADHNAQVRLAAGHALRHGLAGDGVVEALRGVGAQVLYLIAVGVLDVLFDRALVFQRGMVVADRDDQGDPSFRMIADQKVMSLLLLTFMKMSMEVMVSTFRIVARAAAGPSEPLVTWA